MPLQHLLNVLVQIENEMENKKKIISGNKFCVEYKKIFSVAFYKIRTILRQNHWACGLSPSSGILNN
jgi:hypothetical protein